MDCMSQSIRILISLVFARSCNILCQGVMNTSVIEFPHFHKTQTAPTHPLVSQLRERACGKCFQSFLKRYSQLKQFQRGTFSGNTIILWHIGPLQDPYLHILMDVSLLWIKDCIWEVTYLPSTYISPFSLYNSSPGVYFSCQEGLFCRLNIYSLFLCPNRYNKKTVKNSISH